MTFKELLKAEQERPAYLPPPSWVSVQAYIEGLKAALNAKVAKESNGARISAR